MCEPRNLTCERVNRLSQAVADLMESHAAQGRMIARLLEEMSERLASIDTTLTALTKDICALTSEQTLLGNRIEEAFARSLRALSSTSAKSWRTSNRGAEMSEREPATLELLARQLDRIAS